MSGDGPMADRLSAWRSRLATAAEQGHGPESVDRSCQEALHKQILSLMASTRKFVVDPQLSSPGLRPVKLLIEESLQLMRLGVEQLRNAGSAGPAREQFQTLQELCSEVETLLATVANQRRLIERLIDEADLLRRVLAELQTSPQPRPTMIRELVDRVGSPGLGTTAARDWLPLPGVSLSDCLSGDLRRFAWFYVESLGSARRAALALPELSGLRIDEQRLVVSALLLKDAGWLQLIPAARRLGQPVVEYDLRRRAVRHPGTAAALVAGVADLPRRLSLIIGQHHERLDGSGYPAGVDGHVLCPVSRWVLTTTRFQEILTTHFRRPENSPDDALFQTATDFWTEVVRGRLDQGVAGRLLESLQPGLTLRASAAVAASVRGSVDGPHSLAGPHTAETLSPPETSARQSSGAAEVREPKFLRKQRGGQEFYVPPAPGLRKRVERAESLREEDVTAAASTGGTSR